MGNLSGLRPMSVPSLDRPQPEKCHGYVTSAWYAPKPLPSALILEGG